MAQEFRVTTKHPNGLADGVHTFRVLEAPGYTTPKFYALAEKFGCSKDYDTPQAAIKGMCADHACTVINIEEVDATD